MSRPAADEGAVTGLVSVHIAGQTFGVPVLRVQDVIAAVRIDKTPLAPREVAGMLNLRGRIVTAIDMRKRLGVEPRTPEQTHMSVIVEHIGELYALQVDDVGDVHWLPQAGCIPCPVSVSPQWRTICDGLHRLEDALMLVLNIEQTLALDQTRPVAA